MKSGGRKPGIKNAVKHGAYHKAVNTAIDTLLADNICKFRYNQTKIAAFLGLSRGTTVKLLKTHGFIP